MQRYKEHPTIYTRPTNLPPNKSNIFTAHLVFLQQYIHRYYELRGSFHVMHIWTSTLSFCTPNISEGLSLYMAVLTICLSCLSVYFTCMHIFLHIYFICVPILSTHIFSTCISFSMPILPIGLS